MGMPGRGFRGLSGVFGAKSTIDTDGYGRITPTMALKFLSFGLLWRRFETDDAGAIRGARIVPPTIQNQARIEEDLRNSLQAFGLGRSDDELRRHGEMVIRNYDPYISCATHFLKLGVRRL